MLNKINDPKELEDIVLMILGISNDIKKIKSQLDTLSERVAAIDEKVFRAGALSRSRSLGTSMSLDRAEDD
jgi:hypothetical protein